jgi:two-component system chemotaxis response regulator CheB
MPLTAVAPLQPAQRSARYRVLVCDDSAVIRSALVRILEKDPDIQIVGTAPNGQLAIDLVGKTDVDVVLLDIEMPVMDGMTALPHILKARPGVKVVIASTLTRRNAAISIKALTLGATDYVTKPDAAGINAADAFGTELVAKVKAIAQHARSQRARGQPVAGATAPTTSAPASAPITFKFVRSRHGYPRSWRSDPRRAARRRSTCSSAKSARRSPCPSSSCSTCRRRSRRCWPRA